MHNKNFNICDVCNDDYCENCREYDTSCRECGKDTCGGDGCVEECLTCHDLYCPECLDEHACADGASEKELCSECRTGVLEFVKGSEPYTDDHLQCSYCDSTFNLESEEKDEDEDLPNN